MKQKTKLGLELPTDPRWVNMAEMQMEDILTDHAYCEQKAATSCISLIQMYPEKEELVDKLSPVVAEEWDHFMKVVEEIRKRGLKLGRQRKDEYVNELMKFQNKGGSREDRLLERLLTCALIEARSCERFRLLSLHLKEDRMRDFYRAFMISEAGHYKLFLRLAKTYFDDVTVENRWKDYLAYEADMLQKMKPQGNRMH